jgi:hypothetical protein
LSAGFPDGAVRHGSRPAGDHGNGTGAGRCRGQISAIEARRASLADWKRGWVIVSEANFDSLENSWYFNPDQPARGRFSPAFLSKISARFQNLLKAGNLRKVSRSE